MSPDSNPLHPTRYARSMRRGFLRGFANVFIVAYVADSVLTVLHVLLRIVLAPWFESDVSLPVIREARTALAYFVVALAIVALPLMASTKRLAPSVFVPLTMSALWFATGALPFSLSLDLDHEVLLRAVAAIQIGIAVAVMVRVRDLCGHWLFDEEWFASPLFSWSYLALYAVSASASILLATLILSLTSLLLGLELLTGGFLRFDTGGVVLADRRYVLEADPKANGLDPIKRREIRLVAMMHVGEEEAYRMRFRDLGHASALTIVLSEGVSDEKGLLDDGLSYEGLAELLGVTPQRDIVEYIEAPDTHGEEPPAAAMIVRADVDLDEFAPETIEWLQHSNRLYSGNSTLMGFVAVYLEMADSPSLAQTINNDIIDRRNRQLISWIEASRINYREIVVPWGALHLPHIEKAIKEMGFELRASTYFSLIEWRTIKKSLLDRASEVPST